jgi:CheY-like chemotaxis protein
MRPGILAGLKVLVVDEEPDNRQFLIVAIEQLGATAMAAASAPKAIDILPERIGLKPEPRSSGEIKRRLFITPILFLPGRGRYLAVNCQLSTVNCQLKTNT